jgi:hypothetical protein
VADISDLIAIAFVRRALMELGFQLSPDAMSRQADVGALEMWVRLARPELGGATPLAVLQTESGEARIREVLKGLVEPGAGLGG